MGEIKETTKQVRLAQWSEMVKKCKESGLSVKGWCKENHVNEKVYYYRQRKVREGFLERNKAELTLPTSKQVINFAKLPACLGNVPMASPMTAICVGDVKLEIYEGAKEESVRLGLKAVLDLC